MTTDDEGKARVLAASNNTPGKVGQTGEAESSRVKARAVHGDVWCTHDRRDEVSEASLEVDPSADSGKSVQHVRRGIGGGGRSGVVHNGDQTVDGIVAGSSERGSICEIIVLYNKIGCLSSGGVDSNRSNTDQVNRGKAAGSLEGVRVDDGYGCVKRGRSCSSCSVH